MMTRTLLARCAPVAIAASVALPSIPALSQEAATAQPVIVLPETAPPPAASAPAPAIVLPDPVSSAAPPAAAQDVAAARTAPVSETRAPRAATRTTVAERRDVAPSQPAPLAAAPADASTVEAAPMSAAIPPAAVPVEQVAAEPAVTTTTNSESTNEIALAGLLGLLGLGAVGGVAYAASRRRRNRALDRQYEPDIDEAVVVTPAAIETAPQVTAPAFAAPAATSFTAAPVVPARSATRVPLASGDPVALPAELPDSFEERDALLKELVAAEPDKANPFTSPRARARRAKLIMQSLGRNFASRKPRIDLSEYTNRWPALRGWHPAPA